MSDMKLNEITTGVLFFVATLLGVEYCRSRNKYLHYVDSYWQERKGRNRVEREMRKMSDIQLSVGENGSFYVQPIARVEGCYKQCIGTPRQGLLVPSSRAVIHLDKNMSPEALDGLDNFSHVWLSFKFHLNTNVLKQSKAFKGFTVTNGQPNGKFTFTAKITPPMLKKKVGVLSTRSPHRPNPIGITLAKIEKVDKRSRTLHVSSCDLVHDTPIIDIKPYVPMYDSIREARIPNWIEESIDTRNVVTVVPGLEEKSEALLLKYCKLYRDRIDLFWKAIVETLEADVRSSFQTKKVIEGHRSGYLFDIPFDDVLVRYEWTDDRVIAITDILRVEEGCDATAKEIFSTDIAQNDTN